MAHLAAGLANAGIPVTVITDTPCAKAVWAVVDALPMPVNLEVVSTTESRFSTCGSTWRQAIGRSLT